MVLLSASLEIQFPKIYSSSPLIAFSAMLDNVGEMPNEVATRVGNLVIRKEKRD